MTVARPHLVHTVFPVDCTGHLNGRRAGAQNVARAGGSMLAVGLASAVGYAARCGMLAAAVGAVAVAWTVVVDV